MPKSDLPFGSEFSPAQVDLRRLLDLAREHAGDWRAFEINVMNEYFAAHKTSDYNRRKLANNTKLSLIAYGIVDRDVNFTEFGKQLYDVRENDARLHQELARHILTNLHGTTLVQCVLDMHAGAHEISLEQLRSWLDKRGVHFPRGGKHPSIMRLWLEKAGVFRADWRVDETRFQEILRVSTQEIDELARLSLAQRAYLKTLANLPPPGPYPSNEVEKLASTTYGVTFSEKNLPKTVLYPLQQAGFVALQRGTKKAGRGAKPFLVASTEKLIADVVAPLLTQLEQQAQSDLRPFLRKPLDDILRDLTVRDRHVRGLALEALAFRLMRLIDLTYVATRLRGTATGGAEVDLVFESTRLVFSRWQVQCKNTARVSLDDVAKEVGLTHLLKSNVIVLVGTGQIGPEARRYANKVMTDSNLCVVMIDGTDIDIIKTNPTRIVDVFSREAKHAMQIKRIEV